MKKLLRTVLTLLTAAALAVCGPALPALAAVPARPEELYVLDSAGVLSEATEREIISRNEKLFAETGAEIVIVAVDFLDGKEIDDYAYELFNAWGVGSAERNNGLLLVMAVAEDNYYAQSGYGVDGYFTGSRLKQILDEEVEPHFARYDYDGAALGFLGAVYDELKNYRYDDDYEAGDEIFDASPSGSVTVSLFSAVFRVVFTVAVVMVILNIIKSLFRGGGGNGPTGRGGGGGGFWAGMLLGNMLGGRRRYYSPPGRYGGFGSPGFRSPGGFHSPGRTGGSFGGGRSHGGFSHGGGSRGGGAGRH